MADIFREIDEDLRRENFARLWARYGTYLIAFLVLVVLGTAAVVGWRQYQDSQRRAEGVRYAAAAALVQQGKTAEAAAAFAAITHETSSSRAMLASFEEAGLRAKLGKPDAALAIYNRLAADGELDSAYRDLANLLAARTMLGLSGDPKAVVARLKPLTDAENPWHASALEMTALADLKAGDRAAARGLYQKLADDLTASAGVRGRAAEMAAALGR